MATVYARIRPTWYPKNASAVCLARRACLFGIEDGVRNCYSCRVFAAYVGIILIVTGAITLGASAAVVAPAAILRFLFGDRDPDSLTIFIARHWGLLVGLVGGLLVYAGYHSEARLPIMIAAIAEKLAIGVLIFSSPLRHRIAAAAVAGADTVMALLYILILLGNGPS